MSSLKNQAVSGVFWTTIRSIVTSLVGPILLVVKARYLTPEEFGVLAIINIFLQLMNVVENFGLSTAVIQRDKVTKNERSSLFFFQILYCALIGFVIIVTAPLFANIFNMDVLTTLLPILSIVVFLNGPAILFTAFLEKEFHFKELSIVQIIREIVLFISTTVFLLLGWGLLGIVLGQILAVATMVVLVLYVSYRNDLLHLKLHFKLQEIKPFFKFGITIAGKQIMTQLTHNVDELIIGFFLSAEVLGFYHFAKNLLNRLRTLISTAFSKVMLPLLSKVKNDIPRLTRAYNRISKYLGVFAFPIFIGIALTANLFIPVLFGEQWVPSTVFFIILSIAYIPYMLTANLATSLLYSVNKPNLVLYTDVIVNVIYIVLLFLFSWLQLGIYAIVILYAVYLITKTTTLQVLSTMYLHSSFKDYLGLFKNIVLATIAMIVGVLVIQLVFLEFTNLLIELIICIILGAIIYFATFYLLDRNTLFEMKDLVFNR